jgi:peptidoglycan/LPS O-acetylase OafA/YrhL
VIPGYDQRTDGGHMSRTAARFEVLDGWRGIAALMVAVFHFNALHPAYVLPFVHNSYLFVDFFFVLSGFVIAHAYRGRLNTVADAAVFAIRRFGRARLAVLVALGAGSAIVVVTLAKHGMDASMDLGLPRCTWRIYV